MTSKNYVSRSLQRNYSMPSPGWFRDNSNGPWSPKTDDSDPNFDSDEENTAVCGDYPMSSPETYAIVPAQNFVMNEPLLSKVMSYSSPSVLHGSRVDGSRTLQGGSSKSLQIGRPMRSVGLKDIDLTKTPRAVQIRKAKEANRSPSKRHLFSPIRQHSSPAVLSEEDYNICYQGTSYGNKRNFEDDYWNDMFTLQKMGGFRTDSNVVPHTCTPEGHHGLPYPCELPYDATRSKSDTNKNTYNAWEETSRAISSSNSSKYSSLKGTTGTISRSNDQVPIIYSQDRKCSQECSAKPKHVDTGPNSSSKHTISNDSEVIEITDDAEDKSITNGLSSNKSNGTSRMTEKISTQPKKMCRQRKVDKKATRSSSSAHFSEDEEEVKSKSKHTPSDPAPPTECKPQGISQTKQANCRFLGVLFTVAISLVVASMYLHMNPHGLCLEGEFKANLTCLGEVLQQEFYGQHLAKRVLVSSLKSHLQGKGNKPLVLSLHGWTGTGKNFVTGIIARHLFKHGIQSKFIHKFIIPLHFPHQLEAALYRAQLQQWIRGNVSQCSKGGLFIFDEMDKIPTGIVDVLKPFLDGRGAKPGYNFCKMIFIFLSNTGAKFINQYVLEHYQSGHVREKIGLVALEEELHKIADAKPNTWYRELLMSELIDHFVPFLPLERGHIKQCIRKDMRSKGFVILERMVTEVADEMHYFPQGLKLFSVSGCKKVSSKVDVAMG